MSGVTQYRITACCGNQGSTLTSFGTTGGTFQSGLHISTQDVQLQGGFIIEAGQCYTIIQLSAGPPVNPVDYGIFINTELGAEEDCSLYDTTGCECPWLYYISPCCREFGDQDAAAQQVNLALSDLEYEEGTYQYTGSGTLNIPNTNLTLEPGQCYTITRNLQDEPIQTTVELDFSTASWQVMNLELGCNDSTCDDCPEKGIAYLKYVPCCDSFDTIYVRTETYTGSSGQISGSGPGNIGPIVNTAGYTGVFQFVATSQVSQLSAFVPGQCYTGTLHTLGSEVAPAPQDDQDYNNLPLAPYSTQLSKVGDCERPPCPECDPTVYALTNCDGITINTETDVSAYIGTYIELDSIPGCWFVQEYSPIFDTIDPSVPSGKAAFAGSNTGIINNLPGLQTQPVTVIGPCDGCDCKCYEVNGYTGSFTYINCEGKSVIVRSTGADKFCAATRPNIVGKEGIDYTLTIGEDCVDDECVEKCFLLTNCNPTAWPLQDATLNSTLQSLSQYVNTGEVVVLNGYDGCWIVTETEECDCPVDVTVIRDYRDCEECLGITAYKLSNCEKINEVVYTLQDFSAYVGQVIKDDCACWAVEEIHYQPPSETTIVDPIVFEDCNTCLTTYYTLTDCDDSESVIISSTNLSLYVGQVVKIEGCDPCYEVALYEDTAAPALWEEVTVTEASATCFECKQLVPRCSTVFNNSTEDRFFTYVNANGDPEQTELVKSGHFSLRHCVQYWTEPDSFIYNFYGDCTVLEDPKTGTKTGFCVQYFPNDRKVRPGYNTPICSADKYDKITCNAADIMYKKVLELRYGISDCCPEENEKWLIKKELIELQALTDPNYTCDPLTDCCGQRVSSCSCNS